MFRLAVCDDEKQQLLEIQQYMNQYLSLRPDIEIDTFYFSSPKSLLDTVRQNGAFDIYLLDMIMPEQNGITLAKQLQDIKDDPIIIYLTITPDFAIDSYTVHAFQYLLKPIESTTLYNVLDKAINHLQIYLASHLIVKTTDGMIRIPLHSIIYAELSKRCIQYHLINNQLINSLTLRIPFLEATEQLLQDERFISCGTSFVVNLKYISKIEHCCALMENNDRIPIPRNYYNEVKKCWMNYWLRKGEQK